ncbi:hypothetical protein IJG20_03220 [Candidatus Saccharibacteria bacterium]|nr:hypothetical protein [Candidatus Saccharibacteria bacterium]
MFGKSSTFQIPGAKSNERELAFSEARDFEIYNELNQIAEEIERCRSSI